jgi:hypothetical protein
LSFAIDVRLFTLLGADTTDATTSPPSKPTPVVRFIAPPLPPAAAATFNSDMSPAPLLLQSNITDATTSPEPTDEGAPPTCSVTTTDEATTTAETFSSSSTDDSLVESSFFHFLSVLYSMSWRIFMIAFGYK